MSHETIPSRLFEQAKLRPTAPAYWERTNGTWVPTSFNDYAKTVRRAGKALIALGVEPGSTTCILGFNRPEWVIMDVATMAVGAAPAGIYTTCSPEEVAYIIHHAESPVVLVENESQWKKIDKERKNLPHLKHVVLMRDSAKVDDPLVLTWEEFLKKGDNVADEDFFARMHALKPDGLATLIYTSGTTGPPKGVMLSHQNLSWTADCARKLIGGMPDDLALSYLPLSHIAEQMFSIHGPITTGYSIYFAESIDKVPDNLKEVQPTVFFGVPRIWEKFHAGITGKLAQASGVKKNLVEWAMRVGAEASRERAQGREPRGLQYKLANKLIFSKLKPAVGLGRARICVSGAAPIAKEVLEFFASLDIPVLEVYGQSEGTGPTSFNLPNRFKLGTVGPALPGVNVTIAADGEIVVRGPNVFLGYYKEPEATAETLVDGALHSGDLGAFDSDGFLTITGRKKEIIITAGGKNIAPKNIEAALKNHDLVGEAVVIGDRRKYLTCVVTLEPEAAARFAQQHGVSVDQLHAHEKCMMEIQSAIDRVNESLARVEQIKKFTVLKRAFTIEDGELTPTLKVKRKKVAEHFASEIESMYSE